MTVFDYSMTKSKARRPCIDWIVIADSSSGKKGHGPPGAEHWTAALAGKEASPPPGGLGLGNINGQAASSAGPS